MEVPIWILGLQLCYCVCTDECSDFVPLIGQFKAGGIVPCLSYLQVVALGEAFARVTKERTASLSHAL